MADDVIVVRLPAELRETIRRSAKRNDRSFSSEVRRASKEIFAAAPVSTGQEPPQ